MTMPTISGLSFAPRTITNATTTHKNTINNNYKNDLNVDKFTPMSFKGGLIIKTDAFTKIEKALSHTDNTSVHKNAFENLCKVVLPDWKSRFINAKCSTDTSINLGNFNEHSGELELILVKGKEIQEKINTSLDPTKLEENFVSLFNKAEKRYPTGGTMVTTKEFDEFKKSLPEKNCNEFITSKKQDLSEIIESIEKARETFKHADCSSNMQLKIGGFNNEEKYFPMELTEETKGGLLGRTKTNMLGKYKINIYNYKQELENAINDAERITSQNRDFS